MAAPSLLPGAVEMLRELRRELATTLAGVAGIPAARPVRTVQREQDGYETRIWHDGPVLCVLTCHSPAERASLHIAAQAGRMGWPHLQTMPDWNGHRSGRGVRHRGRTARRGLGGDGMKPSHNSGAPATGAEGNTAPLKISVNVRPLPTCNDCGGPLRRATSIRERLCCCSRGTCHDPEPFGCIVCGAYLIGRCDEVLGLCSRRQALNPVGGVQNPAPSTVQTAVGGADLGKGGAPHRHGESA